VGERIWQTITKIEQQPFAFRECEQVATKTKLYRRDVCLSWLDISLAKVERFMKGFLL
jgi:hypothetical protein